MQRRVIGHNVYLAAYDLPANQAQLCDNLITEGMDMVSRPGKQGLFTAVEGAALDAPLPYLKADGGTRFFYATGTDGTGHLKYTDKGTWTKNLVTGDPGNIYPSTAQTARFGAYGYLVDGHRDILRFDLATGAATYTPQIAPTAAPTAALTNTVIDPLTSGGGWAGDTFASYTSGTTLIPNSQTDINAATDGNQTPGSHIGTTWVAQGPTPGIETADGTAGIPATYASTATKWFILDDPNGGFFTRDGSNNPPLSPVLASPNGDRYCDQFACSINYYTSDQTSKQGIKLVCNAYSDTAGTILIASLPVTFTPTFAGQSPGQVYNHNFTFPNLDTPIKSAVLYVVGADTNQNGANVPNFGGFVYVSNVYFAPIDNGITATNTPTGLKVTHSEPNNGYWGAIGGITLTRTYGADQDWSKYDKIVLNFAPSGGLTQQQMKDAGLALRLDFRTNGAPTVHNLSNYMTVADDGTYASIDITTVDAAVRGAFRYLGIVFESDLTVTQTTMNLLLINGITLAGNLSSNSTSDFAYNWVYTEVNASADLTNLINIVESDPSPASNTLNPTLTKAEASLTVGAAVNVATDYYYFYEFGGVFPDKDPAQTYRLFAKVQLGADRVDPAGYWTWTDATRTLTVNEPDINLLYADTLITGRGLPPGPANTAFPTAAQAVCGWANRLWLAAGSTLFGSWAVTQSASAALYFNPTLDPTDPNSEIKGGQWSVGGADNDTIQALVPIGPNLVILKSKSVYILTGTDGSNFELAGHLQLAGVGLAASRAWCLVENRLWFLALDGVWEYDGGDIIQKRSLDIEPFITNPDIDPALFKKAAMLYAGQRIYLFMPKDGDSTGNDCCHVFDTRTGGWTRYLQMNITSACTTSAASDRAEIYLAGLDGMFYQLTGEGDKATSAASATAVPGSLRSRAFGQEMDGESYWHDNIPSEARFAIRTGETTSPTFSVYGADTSAVYSKAYQVTNGHPVRLKDVQGAGIAADNVWVGVDFSTVTKTRLTAWAVLTMEGDI